MLRCLTLIVCLGLVVSGVRADGFADQMVALAKSRGGRVSEFPESQLREWCGKIQSSSWFEPNDLTLHAEVFEWVVRTSAALLPDDRKTVGVRNARITGLIDLEFLDSPHRLMMDGCVIDQLYLESSRWPGLSLGRVTVLDLLDAKNIRVDGDLILNGMECPTGSDPETMPRDVSVNLAGARVHGSLVLNGAKIGKPGDETSPGVGRVLVERARIEGNLVARGAVFGESLNLVHAVVETELSLSGIHAGTVAARGCVVGGWVDLGPYTPRGQDPVSVRIAGNFSFQHASCNGISFQDATIGGTLAMAFARVGSSAEIDSSVFGPAAEDWLGATFEGARLGRLAVTRSTFRGSVNLLDAEVSGLAEFHDCEFTATPVAAGAGVFHAVEGDRITAGMFRVSRSLVEGGLRAMHLTSASQVDLSDSAFFAPTGSRVAVDLQSSGVAGAVHARRVVSHGRVNMDDAVVGGDVELDGHFAGPLWGIDDPGERALSFSRAQIDGRLVIERSRGNLDSSVPRGERPVVIGEIDVTDARLGFFGVLELDERSKAPLIARNTTIGILQMRPSDWDAIPALQLNGWSFDRLVSPSPSETSKSRTNGQEFGSVARMLRVLELGSGDPEIGTFDTQPYTVVANYLDQQGRTSEARQVRAQRDMRNAISVSNDPARSAGDIFSLGRLGDWLWRVVFGPMTGFGHVPMRVAGYFVFFWAIGSFVVWIAHRGRVLLVPEKWEGGPDHIVTETAIDLELQTRREREIIPVMYALDAMLPVIDLGQRKRWRVNPGGYLFDDAASPGRIGRFLQIYLCLHTIAGWFLTTLMILGFTGLIHS